MVQVAPEDRFNKSGETPPETMPSLRTIAMPADTNPSGYIFGGWLVSQMDLAAGSVATSRAEGPAVTVAIEGMVFHQPVYVGDEVSIYVSILKEGTTSLTMLVEAWARHRYGGPVVKVTEGKFVFVALDDDRKPRQLPPVKG